MVINHLGLPNHEYMSSWCLKAKASHPAPSSLSSRIEQYINQASEESITQTTQIPQALQDTQATQATNLPIS